MVSKREKVYHRLLSRKVVSFDEIIGEVEEVIGPKDEKYIYLKYVKRLVEEGKLQRIRKGLYAAVPPLEDESKYVPDKFLIASKLRDNYYLGYHTALEFYGCAYSHFNQAQVAIKKEDRFDQFQHRGLDFRPIFVQNTDFGVEEKEYSRHGVRVSTEERTFIDCLDRVGYAGGWEESLKSLQRLGGLNFNTLTKTLRKYDNDLLRRKAGFALELFRDVSVFYEHLDDKTLHTLREEIGENPRYMAEGESFAYNERWRLYVPENFEEKLRGV